MTCLNVFTMLFSTNYVLETRSDLFYHFRTASAYLHRGGSGCSGRVHVPRRLCRLLPGKRNPYSCALKRLVFGLFHLNFNQFGYAFALGVAFALLLEGTGSIFYGMFAHFLINGFSVIITALSDKILPLTGEESIAAVAESMTTETLVNTFCVYAVIAAVSTCLAGAVYIWIVKHSGRTVL